MCDAYGTWVDVSLSVKSFKRRINAFVGRPSDPTPRTELHRPLRLISLCVFFSQGVRQSLRWCARADPHAWPM